MNKLRRSESGISELFGRWERGHVSKLGNAIDLFYKYFDACGIDTSDPGVIDIAAFDKGSESTGQIVWQAA